MRRGDESRPDDRRGGGRPNQGRRSGGAPKRGRREQRREGTASAARRVAYEAIGSVADDDAYANLVLPSRLREAGLSAADAAFATELVYGTLRLRGRYDAIIALAARRPMEEIDARVADALRLGAHQLLGMRVPSHAAVHESVELVREYANPAAVGFANGVLRTIERASDEEWDARLAEALTGDELVAARTAHPAWILRALRQSLAAEGREAELDALLAADNEAPAVDLVALPGLAEAEDVAEAHAPDVLPAAYAPTSLNLLRGDPHELPEARSGAVRVQDEGSQLVALALAAAALEGRAADAGPERWIDLCAGPGGKAALLAALAAEAGADFTANEVAPHRAELVRRALAPIEDATGRAIRVTAEDGRRLPEWSDADGGFDRILVDAPCTGLGALRRRPEARWRKAPGDVPELAAIQEALLEAALDSLAPGGVVAYVTCSPHLAETSAIAARGARRPGIRALDAAAVVAELSRSPIDLAPRPLGEGTAVQLWPHRHGTDAMYLALLQREA